MIFLVYLFNFYSHPYLQEDANMSNAEIGRREKARLREMQRLKKQKVHEILDAQNAAIEADMVRLFFGKSRCCFQS